MRLAQAGDEHVADGRMAVAVLVLDRRDFAATFQVLERLLLIMFGAVSTSHSKFTGW